MIRILLIIRTLAPAGAEHVAASLALSLDRSRFTTKVVSLTDRIGSSLELSLETNDVDVEYLGKRAGFDHRMYHRISEVINRFRPDIVNTHSSILQYLYFSVGRTLVQ